MFLYYIIYSKIVWKSFYIKKLENPKANQLRTTLHIALCRSQESHFHDPRTKLLLSEK